MSEQEQRYLSEQQTRIGATPEKLARMNKRLNIMIAIMSLLIIGTTIIILNTRESYVEPVKEPVVSEVTDAEKPIAQQPVDEQAAPKENTISQAADANVVEVWTNDQWAVYPTTQTGTHQSIYEQGNIDYEEKLKAAFSVLPIEQESSYVLSARNNGSETSARIVVTNQDKTQNFRIIIEWIDEQGWKPTSVDVLHSAEGVK